MTKTRTRKVRNARQHKKQRAEAATKRSIVRESWVDNLLFVPVTLEDADAQNDDDAGTRSETRALVDGVKTVATVGHEGIEGSRSLENNQLECDPEQDDGVVEQRQCHHDHDHHRHHDHQQQQHYHHHAHHRHHPEHLPIEFSIISWNVLAEAYCSPRSHPNLPSHHDHVVFHAGRRKKRILQCLRQLTTDDLVADIICLQEVDLNEIGKEFESLGYQGVETARVSNGGGSGARTDSCAVYARSDKFQIQDLRLLRLDDLAFHSSNSQTNEIERRTPETDKNSNNNNNTGKNGTPKPVNSNFQGLQHSFLRRNSALLVRLQHIATGQTLVVANAHLFWNPGYEYVKLCQAHYIMTQAHDFAHDEEAVVFAGDLNSRPNGCTHSYLTQGRINAKQVAPWYAYHHYNPDADVDYKAGLVVDGDGNSSPDENQSDDDNGTGETFQKKKSTALELANKLSSITLNDDKSELRPVRYLLDATLNKLTRWFRIMGIDAALETEEEEVLQTQKGKMVIFERCQHEQRTLITSSTRLMARRECPAGTYCINPSFLPDLEVAMAHVLLTHGYELEPEKFLTRCVVCNGDICEVDESSEKYRILNSYEAPTDHVDEMEVYECNNCGQGYWWDDRPTSSASRVKSAATNLFLQCLRAGVPIKNGSCLGMFEGFVNVKEERERGWDFNSGSSSEAASTLLKQKLDVVEWLKDDNLTCPFEFQSVYASDSGVEEGHKSDSERIPFTNVTFSFVNTLDYIFYEPSKLELSARLHVPTSFKELNDSGIAEKGGHLLPSDVWPSDHLAIGAVFMMHARAMGPMDPTVQEHVGGQQMNSGVAVSHTPGQIDHELESSNRRIRNNEEGPTDPNDEGDGKRNNDGIHSVESAYAPRQVGNVVSAAPPATQGGNVYVVPVSGSSPFCPIGNADGTCIQLCCTPPTPSLFEMARRRKLLKEQQQLQTQQEQ